MHRDLSVACVLDYKIDSLQTLDVAMVHAKDSASWLWLVAEFHLDTLSPSLRQTLATGGEVLQTSLVRRDAPQHVVATPDTASQCLRGVAYRERTVWVFYYRNAVQLAFLQEQLALSAVPCDGTDALPGASFYCFEAGADTPSNAFNRLFQR